MSQEIWIYFGIDSGAPPGGTGGGAGGASGAGRAPSNTGFSGAISQPASTIRTTDTTPTHCFRKNIATSASDTRPLCIVLRYTCTINDVDNVSPIWTPNPNSAASSQLARFMRFVNAYEARPRDYQELWQWSVAEPEKFWSAVHEFCGVIGTRPTGPVLSQGTAMPGAKWFAGAKLNFAENLLAHRGSQAAIIARDECGARRELSRDVLAAEVARIAAGLRAAGIVSGDCVAGFMPNVPETVIAMLAAASVGAIWTSCSPDFGSQGVLDRFGQVTPKALFVASKYRYAGKEIDCLPRIAQLAASLPSVETIVISALDPTFDLSLIPQARRFEQFGRRDATLDFQHLDFDHPLYVLYSSGTTGVPKCIVHGAGGTLLQHLKEHQLHTDLRSGDRLFFFTTCGWMMWNWLVSALASGVTIVLYDGSPTFPDEGELWRLAEEEHVDVFGTSPKYLATIEKAGYRPREHHALEQLRTLLCTGSPLAPEQYDFVHDAVGAHVQVTSISGGTDIVSCFALGNPLLPVYRGEIQCIGLGLKVEVWDDAGRVLQDAKGELVCVAPFPCMPVGFWNDVNGARYRAAYFERFPGVWHHGDYAILTRRGTLMILGRSDAVLNPGGIRIGTAEIYRQVESIDEVLESVVIGQDWQNDVRVVLFVRLREGLMLDAALIEKIRQTIRANTTPRHVPARILQVPEVPRTISGKVVELAVRNIVHGLTVNNVEALANPAALEHFRDRIELRE